MELLKQHVRVTASLIVREMSTRFGNKPGGYIWALLDPVAHVALMTVIFQAFARTPALGSSFSLFFASGYLPFMCYQAMAAFISGTVRANKALLSYPIVSPFDAVISRYTVQVMTSLLIAFLVIALIVAEEDVPISFNIGVLLSACLAATALGFGIGLTNITLFARSQLYEQIYSIVTRPMFMVSGVFFLPDSLPQPYTKIMLYNPVVHLIMWFRTGIYREYRATGMDMFYVLEVIIVLTAAALLLFAVSTKELREERIQNYLKRASPSLPELCWRRGSPTISSPSSFGRAQRLPDYICGSEDGAISVQRPPEVELRAKLQSADT